MKTQTTNEQKIFTHQCGRTYFILEQKGNYTLLMGTADYCDKFIVAWCIDNVSQTWGQGYYFDKEQRQRAFDFFERKVSEAA